MTNPYEIRMKSPIHSLGSASPTHRASAVLRFGLMSAFLLGVVCSGPVTAAVTPDSKPKEWLANPAKHKVSIRREVANKKESAMIAAAEAAQPRMEALRKAAGEGEVPAGDKVWWYEEKLGIRIPYAITAETVAYYSEVVGNYGKQVFNRYIEPSSQLDYHASSKMHKEFRLDGKTFKDVHVVTLKLSFAQSFAATQTEAMEFRKERVVILDDAGKVLHVSGDGPTEVPIMAI